MVNTGKEIIMARRGENIRKRKDGRWEARYMKGRREDGGIKYGYVYSYKYSDVKKKRQEALKLLEITNCATGVQSERIQFIKFADDWMEFAIPISITHLRFTGICQKLR